MTMSQSLNQATQGRIDIQNLFIHLAQGKQAFEALHDISITIAP